MRITTLLTTLVLTSQLLAGERLDEDLRQRMIDDPDRPLRIVIILEAESEETRDERAGLAQARFFESLPEGALEIRHVYQTVPGVSGLANSAGIDAILATGRVQRIGLDRKAKGRLHTSVPFIEADVIHQQGFTGAGTTVAVLDTGIDTDHPDLLDNLAAGAHTFLDAGATSQAGAEDDNGHGTLVAGVITSQGTVAGVGVAPDADILAVKVLDHNQEGWFSDFIAGVDYVVANHANYNHVAAINMSFSDEFPYPECGCNGYYTVFALLGAATGEAWAVGIPTFAASGPPYSGIFCDGMAAPACLDSIIPVGSIDHRAGHTISSDTTMSECGALVAPGQLIASTAMGGGTLASSGPSLSTAHCSGIAALMVSAGESLSPGGIYGRLMDSGTPAPSNCLERLGPQPASVNAKRAIHPERYITHVFGQEQASAWGLGALELGGAVMDFERNFYVLDEATDQILRISNGGLLTVAVDGTEYKGKRGLSLLHNGWVGYCSTNADRAMVIGTTGGLGTIMNSNGVGSTAMLNPTALKSRGVDNYTIASTGRNAVFRRDRYGNEFVAVGEDGDGVTPLLTPLCAAIDPDGVTYTAGYGNHTLFRSDTQVTLLMDSSTPGFETPRDVVLDYFGNVYVACVNTHKVFKVDPNGQHSVILDETGDGQGNLARKPIDLEVDQAGRLFVGCRVSENVFRIDQDGSIEMIIGPEGDGLGNPLGQVESIALDGQGSVLVCSSDSVFLVGRPWDGFGDVGVRYCSPANLNSTGGSARIDSHGSAYVALNSLTLTVDGLPNNSFAMLVNSQNTGSFTPPGSQGVLCLSGTIGRHRNDLVQSNGGFGFVGLDLPTLPSPGGGLTVTSGTTVYFQYWYRDGQTSNFSDALCITFQ